jgi:hypothetical protein
LVAFPSPLRPAGLSGLLEGDPERLGAAVEARRQLVAQHAVELAELLPARRRLAVRRAPEPVARRLEPAGVGVVGEPQERLGVREQRVLVDLGTLRRLGLVPAVIPAAPLVLVAGAGRRDVLRAVEPPEPDVRRRAERALPKVEDLS